MSQALNDPKRGLQYEGEAGDIRDDAFHGTTLENALKIKEQGFLPRLGIAGVGCYLDLGDDSSAKTFALKRAGGDPDNAVVIRAEVHLGTTLNISFRRNPEVKRQFQQFQLELKGQIGMPYELTFNEEKERFLREHYPNVNAVLYFDERTGVWYVAVRDPQRIRILSAVTLNGREL